MIRIKTTEEIKILREGGKILASVLHKLNQEAKRGIATIYLDQMAEDLIRKEGGEPSFKKYKTRDDKIPFPASLCVSINDEVVHGIPCFEKLREGDIVSLDLGMKWKGLYTDATISFGIDRISDEAKKLLDVTKVALEKGIGAVKEGATIGDIGFAVQSYVEASGFNVVKELVGHGVGYFVHEEPEIPNFGKKRSGEILKEGMVLALEPMVCIGSADVVLDKNGWTWKTKDGSLSAHFEHTIVVMKKGADVLTKL